MLCYVPTLDFVTAETDNLTKLQIPPSFRAARDTEKPELQKITVTGGAVLEGQNLKFIEKKIFCDH